MKRTTNKWSKKRTLSLFCTPYDTRKDTNRHTIGVVAYIHVLYRSNVAQRTFPFVSKGLDLSFLCLINVLHIQVEYSGEKFDEYLFKLNFSFRTY